MSIVSKWSRFRLVQGCPSLRIRGVPVNFIPESFLEFLQCNDIARTAGIVNRGISFMCTNIGVFGIAENSQDSVKNAFDFVVCGSI
jgi:hypothetical protein